MNLPALSSSITDTAMDMVPSLGEISASLLRPFNISTFKLGSSGGNKRVWLQTRYLERIGLERHSPIEIQFSKTERQITISKSELGKYRVSGRANGLPIIDLKNKQVADTLGQNVEKITVRFYPNKVTISVSSFDRNLADRRSKTGAKAVEIFSGGGTLSKFAELAGFKMDTVVERDDSFVDVFEKNFDEVTTIVADVHDVEMEDLPKDASLLQFGYPCTEFSPSNIVSARKAKDAKQSEKALEAKRTANYLSLALVNIIRQVNPRVILIEEVKAFQNSLPFDLLKFELERMKYKISIEDMTGSFTERKRIAIVAIADKEALDISNVVYQTPVPIEAHLDIPVQDREFQPIELRPRESGALRKGLGIRSHQPSDLKINTITTHWTRHNHISLAHPHKEHHYSDFTVNEVRRIHGLPEDFDLGDKVTVARAVLGQGVVDGFLDVLSRIFTRVCLGGIESTPKEDVFGCGSQNQIDDSKDSQSMGEEQFALQF
jgi:site-specific DNA-cytosine methylase